MTLRRVQDSHVLLGRVETNAVSPAPVVHPTSTQRELSFTPRQREHFLELLKDVEVVGKQGFTSTGGARRGGHVEYRCDVLAS